MKLGIIAGWMAAGILGASIILGQSTASAEFVTVDEFEGDEPKDSRFGDGREFTPDSSSASGGTLSMDFEQDLWQNWNGSLWYQAISIEGLTSLHLTGVSNNSGGNVSVEAILWDGLRDDDDRNELDMSEGAESGSNIDFSVTGTADAKALEFFFMWAPAEGSGEATSPTGDFTSTSLQAKFETAGSGGSPQAVPEPTSLVLFGLASAGGGIAAWRKRRKQSVKSSASAVMDTEM